MSAGIASAPAVAGVAMRVGFGVATASTVWDPTPAVAENTTSPPAVAGTVWPVICGAPICPVMDSATAKDRLRASSSEARADAAMYTLRSACINDANFNFSKSKRNTAVFFVYLTRLNFFNLPFCDLRNKAKAVGGLHNMARTSRPRLHPNESQVRCSHLAAETTGRCRRIHGCTGNIRLATHSLEPKATEEQYGQHSYPAGGRPHRPQTNVGSQR